jgi:hypothetical protein
VPRRHVAGLDGQAHGLDPVHHLGVGLQREATDGAGLVAADAALGEHRLHVGPLS